MIIILQCIINIIIYYILMASDSSSDLGLYETLFAEKQSW